MSQAVIGNRPPRIGHNPRNFNKKLLASGLALVTALGFGASKLINNGGESARVGTNNRPAAEQPYVPPVAEGQSNPELPGGKYTEQTICANPVFGKLVQEVIKASGKSEPVYKSIPNSCRLENVSGDGQVAVFGDDENLRVQISFSNATPALRNDYEESNPLASNQSGFNGEAVPNRSVACLYLAGMRFDRAVVINDESNAAASLQVVDLTPPSEGQDPVSLLGCGGGNGVMSPQAVNLLAAMGNGL